MKAERLQVMPDWPARMTSDVACMYMCVSQNTFLTRYGDLGVREEGNVFWARTQLDAIIAKQFKLSQARKIKERDDSWDDVR